MSAWADLQAPAERELVVGLYDLTNYTSYCEHTAPLRALDVMTRYTALAAGIIHGAGGWFVKPIGDAGLFIFAADAADDAVEAMRSLQTVGDTWLTAEGYPGHVRAGLHCGPVAIGRIGREGVEQRDIIGKTVNIATRTLRPECTLSLTPAVFRKLSAGARALFKKHTPPVSYIALDDRRPR